MRSSRAVFCGPLMPAGSGTTFGEAGSWRASCASSDAVGAGPQWPLSSPFGPLLFPAAFFRKRVTVATLCRVVDEPPVDEPVDPLEPVDEADPPAPCDPPPPEPPE